MQSIVSPGGRFAMRTSSLLFALLLSTSIACAQHNGPTGQRQADRAEDQFEKSVPPPTHQQSSVDLAKLKSDADELMALSQSIHSSIGDVEKGMLPKDLTEKLKQVEKLSKRLRNELTP
jgi:hypothetical protein